MDYGPPLLYVGFSRQDHWNGLPCPPPGDLPNPGMVPVSLTSLASPALAGRFFTTNATWEASYDQIANICWIIEKATEFQKSTDYAKAFGYMDHNKLGNSSGDGNTRPPDLTLEKSVCRSGSNS